MSLMPEGELLRKAVKWVSDERRAHPGKNIDQLIEQASLIFDLPPKDAEFLARFLRENQ